MAGTVALLTFKMRRVYAHMQFSPHCRQHIRELPQLYAERQRQLRRLRLSDPERYTTCLARCGIEPRLATAHITWSRTGRRARKRAKEQEWQRRHPGWNKAW
jgi:ribosomal protein S15P/S13E